MSSNPSISGPPKDFLLLEEPKFANPDDPERPNRLCICLSDLHFTDGTVGDQSAENVVWEEVFNDIRDLCLNRKVKELHLILVGDIADMIRTAAWSAELPSPVYPWERSNPKFKTILRKVLDRIVSIHADPPKAGKKPGFFYLLKQLSPTLESQGCKVRLLVLLGNHDKEILADDGILKDFYEKCLGQPIENLSPEYRRWVGEMYFGDNERFKDAASVPWAPFYWGDRGFRLFVTHGQWRDQDNSRRFAAQGGKPGWQVSDGWRPDVWRQLAYAPFTEACFGDSVAAGVLSGFIYRAKTTLQGIVGGSTADVQKEIRRLNKILDELDLYRPTSAAVKRVIQEIWRLRKKGSEFAQVRTLIENELLASVSAWLSWSFTLDSASTSVRWILRIAKPIVALLKLFGGRVSIGFIYFLMSLLDKLQQWQRDDPSYKEMSGFPGFLEDYRKYGFRIHGEGHTHIPLQEELHFPIPDENKNYTYVNFGAWRDQVVTKQSKGYRRRGVGRALFIIDSAAPVPGQGRRYAYWVQDVMSWSHKADNFGVKK